MPRTTDDQADAPENEPAEVLEDNPESPVEVVTVGLVDSTHGGTVKVRLAAAPGGTFQPGDGLPTIQTTWTDVSVDQLDQVRQSAAAHGLTLIEEN